MHFEVRIFFQRVHRHERSPLAKRQARFRPAVVAERGRGLDTCPQAAFTQYHKIIGQVLQLPASEMVVCGMSLGYADPDRIENSLITERESVPGFVKFMD